MVTYCIVFGIGGSPPSEETTEKIILPSGYAGGSTIFLRRRLREGNRERSFSLRDNFAHLSKCTVSQGYPAKRRVQASNPEDTALATFRVATSSNPRTISQIEWC